MSELRSLAITADDLKICLSKSEARSFRLCQADLRVHLASRRGFKASEPLKLMGFSSGPSKSAYRPDDHRYEKYAFLVLEFPSKGGQDPLSSPFVERSPCLDEQDLCLALGPEFTKKTGQLPSISSTWKNSRSSMMTKSMIPQIWIQTQNR